MRPLVKAVTPAGGLVLDPFAGSGSTGVAALAEGFRFLGVEIDPEYVPTARARLQAASVASPAHAQMEE
jgi:DNA modification methylase